MNAPQEAPSVQLIDVMKHFGGAVAVDRVSLSIGKGEFFSFLGPSGCGKTTTLRLIGGLEMPDSGSIYINGECVNDLPPYERNVSTVFQRLALFPHLTVAENLAFGLKIQGQPARVIRDKVAKILELVHLPGLEHRYPDQISGGQQQRVALARSLVLEPEVLLLDEPLSALDRKLRKEMQVELRRIQREVGITFIYVTHDQKEAISMSDRIAIMKDGKIVQVGTPQEIFERPRTAFVADFMGASNLFAGQLIGQQGQRYLKTKSGLIIHLPHARQPLCVNGPQLLALRPEAIEIYLKNQDPPWENCFAGRVLNRSYLGETLEFEVLLQGVERVKIHTHSRSVASRIAIDEEVLVCWDPDSACLLREEEQE
jgi:spermidine/putrescine transport system ATP-binding protein